MGKVFKSNIFKIVFLGVLILIMVEELNLVDLSYVNLKSEIKKSVYTTDEYEYRKQQPITVVYNNKKSGSISESEPLEFTITDIDFGFAWVPFYKNSTFSFTATAKDLRLDNQTELEEPAGEISGTGEYKIIGLCSYSKTKELIVGDVLKSFK